MLSKKDEYKKSVIIYQIWMLALQSSILFFTIWLGFKYTSNVKDNIIATNTGLTLSIIFTVMLLSHPRFNEKKKCYIWC